MTYKELLESIRHRWKGIATTDPKVDDLKRLVHHGLLDIKAHCPMAFLDDRGSIVALKNETDFFRDWNEDENVPLPPELYEAVIAFALWKLYIRDQSDVRDQSVTSMMRRDYFDALGIQQAGG